MTWRFSPRKLTRIVATGVFAATLTAPPSATASPPLTEQEKAIHALNRLTFGARPGDIHRVLEMGVHRFIKSQLHPQDLPDPRVEEKLSSLGTLTLSSRELFEAFPPPQLQRRRKTMQEGGSMEPKITAEELRKSRQQQRQIVQELVQARLLRAVYSERQLQEVLVDFWMNHFNVFAAKGLNRFLVSDFEHRVIRPRVFGRFEDLLVAVAQSPAMLYYLDNWLSSAPQEEIRTRLRELARTHPDASRRLRGLRSGARREMLMRVVGPTPALFQARGLNENYARELLELHTLGVDGGYDQEDVVQVARCFTGWTLTGPDQGAQFYFQPLMHETGDKEVLGEKIPSGGVEEGLHVLRMLARHPSTARFISTKLVRRFVADDPPEALVDEVMRTFQRTGGEIREMLRTLFDSPLFWSPQVYRAKVKKPFELVASTLRATAAETTGHPFLFRSMAEMGEILYHCLQPNGYPDTAESWINTNSLLKRLNFATAIAAGRVPGVRVDLEAAEQLFEELGLPDPTLSQSRQTRELLGDSQGTRSAPSSRVVSAAFKLGSPQFQKR